MPAPEKIKAKIKATSKPKKPAAKAKKAKAASRVKKLGIIAGGGCLPGRLLHACDQQGIESFVIGFEGQTDPAVIKDHQHMWTRLGAAGQVVKTFKAHDITDIVLIGSIRRPSLAELRPDVKTAKFFARIGMKALGDDGLLGALRKELENDGFTIHGIQKFATDLLAGKGIVGKHKPNKEQKIDIQRGLEISQELGKLDIGQAVIVQQGIVLGVEAIEGTDALIERTRHLKRKGRGGVLVKTCKPQQDQDFDLPTIGPETIRMAAKAGLSGVAVHAGYSLILDPEQIVTIANKHKIFVIGVDLPKSKGGKS